jgi:stalled ribosome rescue protein Dom34
MAKSHAIVWIDHHKAVVWKFLYDEQSKTIVKARDQHEHTHLRKSPHGGHRVSGDHEFFEEVLKSLSEIDKLLVIGPAQTKDEWIAFIRAHHPPIAFSIAGVDKADHPSDAEVLAYAREHFSVIDKLI